jgi:hypothetical protein
MPLSPRPPGGLRIDAAVPCCQAFQIHRGYHPINTTSLFWQSVVSFHREKCTRLFCIDTGQSSIAARCGPAIRSRSKDQSTLRQLSRQPARGPDRRTEPCPSAHSNNSSSGGDDGDRASSQCQNRSAVAAYYVQSLLARRLASPRLVRVDGPACMYTPEETTALLFHRAP